MENTKTFLETFEPTLKRIETVLLITLLLGIATHYIGLNTFIAVQFSLFGLSALFLVYAFIPVNVSYKDGDSFGFNELLAWSVLPKILWISTAAGTFGIGIYTLDLSHDGYLRAITVGGAGILLSIVILSIQFLSGTKNMNKVLMVFLRAVPVLIVALQLFTSSI